MEEEGGKGGEKVPQVGDAGGLDQGVSSSGGTRSGLVLDVKGRSGQQDVLLTDCTWRVTEKS